jgi:hypothetical protein
MLESRNKTDLIIEVWERLDCESIGAAELIAIETAVRDQFGPAAVDSPMVLARMLADEGAELRHSEIMQLFVDRNEETLYDATLRNIIDIDDLEKTHASINRMENLRRKFIVEDDKEGQRLLREKAVRFKDRAHQRSIADKAKKHLRLMNAEIAEWLTNWLRTPEMFETWVTLRLRSPEFQEWFGEAAENE